MKGRKKKQLSFFNSPLVWNILHLIGKHYWQGLQQRALDYTTYWCFCLFRVLRVVIVIWWDPESTMQWYITNFIFWGNGKITETWCFFVWFLGDMLIWQRSFLLYLRFVFLQHILPSLESHNQQTVRVFIMHCIIHITANLQRDVELTEKRIEPSRLKAIFARTLRNSLPVSVCQM